MKSGAAIRRAAAIGAKQVEREGVEAHARDLRQAYDDAAASAKQATPVDPTNPAHYRSHPSGVEAIQITEHLGFCLGNAVKYIWRAYERPERTIEDLRKSVWYLEREIARLEKPIPYRLTSKGRP